MAVTVVDLEIGMPTVEQAMQKLAIALRLAQSRQETVIKVIHGYGSTGKGGRIKTALHQDLVRKRGKGLIKAFIPGEKFSPFDAVSRFLLEAAPPLARDKDYAKGNPGITLIWLK